MRDIVKIHKKDPNTFNIWYDLMVDDKLLVSIKGKETAEWFLKSMKSGKTGACYTLIQKPTEDEVLVSNIKAVKPW